jgi:predicted nucleic acid-binding protein
MASPADSLVVDASVAAKWQLGDEDYAREALLVLERFADGSLTLFAPRQIRYEVASAIAVATGSREPRLSIELGRQALAKFLTLGLTLIDDDELTLEAYDLVHQHGIALYDAHYLALSRRLQMPLVTADRRLQQRVGQLPNVVWIGDYVDGA